MTASIGNCPRVTVVVLTYNRCQELLDTLGRLVAAQKQCPIVVVDNGSTDGSETHVRRQFPQVTLVRAPRNLGAAGRNLGVQCVRTPYVAFNDDDTCWAPGSLECAADILDGHPHVTVLTASIMVQPGHRSDPTCLAMADSPLQMMEGIGPCLVGFMAGACVMRASAFRSAGGYWAPLFLGGEETLLAMDILQAGGSIVYAPVLTVQHRPSPVRDGAGRRRMLARNALWAAWLRLPWSMALKRSVQILSGLPGSRARVRALKDAMAGWHRVRHERRCLRPEVCTMFARVWSHEQSHP